jgi:hypothetical protein
MVNCVVRTSAVPYCIGERIVSFKHPCENCAKMASLLDSIARDQLRHYSISESPVNVHVRSHQSKQVGRHFSAHWKPLYSPTIYRVSLEKL